MRNTLAIGCIVLGGLLIYGGFKNWTLAETIRFFTGQDTGPEAGSEAGSEAGPPPEAGEPGAPDPNLVPIPGALPGHVPGWGPA